MKRLRVTDFGPIHQADIKFGDLTVLVGPQASGKSLFVQLYKLIEDASAIANELSLYGYEWRQSKNAVAAFSSVYFGEGLETIFSLKTRVTRDSKSVDPSDLVQQNGTAKEEAVFIVPAQRVLVLQDGWPKPFMAYGAGDPYVIRRFSETLRRRVDRMSRVDIDTLIALPDQRKAVDAAIYGGLTLTVRRDGPRRQLVLFSPNNKWLLPYGVWSAGQREFTPLFLGLFAAKSTIIKNSGALTTVIIEEPEMGLHPQAIITTVLLALELLAVKFRVIISTHSPAILDLVWGIRELSQLDPDVAVEALIKIFNIETAEDLTTRILEGALRRTYRTYFFNCTDAGVVTQDISTLDPGDEDENIAGWGGLSGFSGRIAQIVGEACSR